MVRQAVLIVDDHAAFGSARALLEALYSVPGNLIGSRVDARADRLATITGNSSEVITEIRQS
jgi:hypothetical protein